MTSRRVLRDGARCNRAFYGSGESHGCDLDFGFSRRDDDAKAVFDTSWSVGGRSSFSFSSRSARAFLTRSCCRLTRRVHSRPVAPDSVWELVFLMVILKIPIVYLCSVVYVAIKAKPHRGRGDAAAVRVGSDLPPSGSDRLQRIPRRRPPRPHGGPARAYARTPRTAYARAPRIGPR